MDAMADTTPGSSPSPGVVSSPELVGTCPAMADTSPKRKTASADTDLALHELYAASPTGTPTIALAFGDELWQKWIDEVRSNPAYHLRDPNNPDDAAGATGSAGGSPMPALIVEYGPGANQYVSTVFDAGQAIVQDGADPTGKAWKFPEAAWRRFVSRVRGEELPDDEEPEGPTMHEAAAEQNARTFGARERERQHGVPEATGVDENRAQTRTAGTRAADTGKSKN